MFDNSFFTGNLGKQNSPYLLSSIGSGSGSLTDPFSAETKIRIENLLKDGLAFELSIKPMNNEGLAELIQKSELIQQFGFDEDLKSDEHVLQFPIELTNVGSVPINMQDVFDGASFNLLAEQKKLLGTESFTVTRSSTLHTTAEPEIFVPIEWVGYDEDLSTQFYDGNMNQWVKEVPTGTTVIGNLYFQTPMQLIEDSQVLSIEFYDEQMEPLSNSSGDTKIHIRLQG